MRLLDNQFDGPVPHDQRIVTRVASMVPILLRVRKILRCIVHDGPDIVLFASGRGIHQFAVLRELEGGKTKLCSASRRVAELVCAMAFSEARRSASS